MHIAVYELQGPGKDGQDKFFTKPWAMTTIMFLGMSFCLPWAYWEEYKHKQQAQRALENANGHAEPLLHGDTLVSFTRFIHICAVLNIHELIIFSKYENHKDLYSYIVSCMIVLRYIPLYMHDMFTLTSVSNVKTHLQPDLQAAWRLEHSHAAFKV